MKAVIFLAIILLALLSPIPQAQAIRFEPRPATIEALDYSLAHGYDPTRWADAGNSWGG